MDDEDREKEGCRCAVRSSETLDDDRVRQLRGWNAQSGFPAVMELLQGRRGCLSSAAAILDGGCSGLAPPHFANPCAIIRPPALKPGQRETIANTC